MTKYTWKKEEFPNHLKVKQVYGIAFSNEEKILLHSEEGAYKLTGGNPESGENYIETLKREFLEEINTTLEDIHYLGYLEVKEEGKIPFAQVRMIAKIKNIGKPIVDIATGKMYEQHLVSSEKVKNYLNYEEEGNKMLDDAIKLAREKYSFIASQEER